jgi:hypothetical protein
MDQAQPGKVPRCYVRRGRGKARVRKRHVSNGIVGFGWDSTMLRSNALRPALVLIVRLFRERQGAEEGRET